MVCSICKQTGHTKPRCPIKREYGAVLYKYIISHNSYHNLNDVFAGLSFCFAKVSLNDLDILGEFIVNKKQYTEIWDGRTKWERSIPNGMGLEYRRHILERLQELPFQISRANYKKEMISHYIINNRDENLLNSDDEYLIRNGTLNAHFHRLLMRPNMVQERPKARRYNINLTHCTNIHIAEEDSSCPICYETLDQTNVAVSNCNHKTCAGCFERCLNEFKTKNKIPTCCMCRASITNVSLSNESVIHNLVNNHQMPELNEVIIID